MYNIEKAIAESEQFMQQLQNEKHNPSTILTELTEQVKHHMLNFALSERTTDIDRIIDFALEETIATENEIIFNLFKPLLEKQITDKYIDYVLSEVAEQERETELYHKNPSAYYGVREEKVTI